MISKRLVATLLACAAICGMPACAVRTTSQADPSPTMGETVRSGWFGENSNVSATDPEWPKWRAKAVEFGANTGGAELVALYRFSVSDIKARCLDSVISVPQGPI